jgi:hypothetical protein
VVLALACGIGCGDGGSSNSSSGGGGGVGNGNTGGSGGSSGATGQNPRLEKFSFFLISVGSVRSLSGSQDGFGGDLRFGEEGVGAGLRGADKICAKAAEIGMPGAGSKTWRAFLSSTTGGSDDGPVHAKDRIGAGPWYDALGRRVASNLTELLKERPGDADLAIRNDLPNEYGTPNHMDGAPGCTGSTCPDNHQVLTGTAPDGTLFTGTEPMTDATCDDWTSSEPSGQPRSGHSWPRGTSGANWMSAYNGAGCAPCALAVGASVQKCVGSTGGYGGFYCFALPAGG